MSDAVKWALAAAVVVSIIALILTLPFVKYITESNSEINTAVYVITDYCYDAFYYARGLINIFLTSFGAKLLSGIMIYLFSSWVIKLTIKTTVWVFHFIFK